MKKAFIFDFDNTLAITTARIKVMKISSCLEKAELVGFVTPSQFSNYPLDLGEYFDFSEFSDNKFIENADPTFLIHLAKEVSQEHQDIYILTAREDDSADAIQAFLKEYGIKARQIHCVGGTQETIPIKKRNMLLTIMEGYDKLYFFDDCPNNIDSAPNHDKLKKYHYETN